MSTGMSCKEIENKFKIFNIFLFRSKMKIKYFTKVQKEKRGAEKNTPTSTLELLSTVTHHTP